MYIVDSFRVVDHYRESYQLLCHLYSLAPRCATVFHRLIYLAGCYQMCLYSTIYQLRCHLYPSVLQFQTGCTRHHIHTVIADFHLNHHAITIPELANWGPAHAQPVGLICHISINFRMAETLPTICFLLYEPLVDCLNGQHHDNSAWTNVMSGTMGYPRLGKSTIMEM